MDDSKSPDAETLVDWPGLKIVRSRIAETMVPYHSSERPDGNHNYGWMDLRDRPESVLEIPEANKSPGLAQILRVVAHPISKLISTACECGEFENETDPSAPPFFASGFVVIIFKELENNKIWEDHLKLARHIVGGIRPSEDHNVGFNFVIEPLKDCFGLDGCFALTVHPIGRGADRETARRSFEYASMEVAAAIERGRNYPIS